MRLLLLCFVPMQILFVGYGVEAKQSAGYCAMYDICGARSDGKVLNCPFNIPSVKVSVFFFFHLLLKMLILLIVSLLMLFTLLLVA